MPNVWPLVGRKRELAQVAEGLVAGRHQLIVGDAGVGKSRLAAEAVASIIDDGVIVRRIAGNPAASAVPLASFAALAPGRSGGDALEAVLHALAVDRRGFASLPILHVDDAHWLDEASTVVLHQLAVDGRVRLIVTMRSGESVSPAVSAFLRGSSVDVTNLEQLPDEELMALLRSAIEGPIDGATEARLVRFSGGNTLFLIALTDGAIDAGLLVRVGGLWRLTGDVAIAPMLEDVLRSRFASISVDERDAAEMIALAGDLPLDLLMSAVPAAAVEQLERAGLVQIRDERVSLSHPLYAEILVLRLPKLARMRLCSLLADLFERRGLDSQQARLQSALWRLEGGVRVDHDRLLGGAQEALAAGDTALAARLGAAAFGERRSVDAALMTSWCLAEQGDHPGALGILREAIVVPEDPLEQATLAMRIAEELWWGERETAAALDVLEQARDRHGLDPAAALIDSQRAVFAMLRGDCDEARSAGPLLNHPLSSVRFVSSLAVALGMIYGDAAAEGVEVAQHAFDDALANPPHAGGNPGTHIVSKALGLIHADRLTEAGQLADFVYQATIYLASRQARAWAAAVRGQSELHSGLLAESWRDLREATALWVDCSVQGLARWCSSGAVLAAAARGDVDSANESLVQASEFDGTGFEILNVTFERARSWVAVMQGAPDDGAALSNAIAEAVSIGNVTEAIGGVVDLARLGLHEATSRMVTEIPWRSPAAQLRHRFVSAVLAADPEMLEAIAEDLAKAGLRVLQAESHALAALAFRERGDARAAGICQVRVRELSKATGALTPILGRLSSSSLSRREHEVAVLAAAGRTSHQIAQQLFVSERTIENHLYRVFGKLGVTSRAELAGISLLGLDDDSPL